jgi:hypothetical protein
MIDFNNILSTIDMGFKASTDFISLLNGVKGLLQKTPPTAATAATIPGQTPLMQPFQPQFTDPFAGGQQWLPQLQQMAQRNGNGWVPTQVQPLGNINLTGVWSPPMNPMDQTYIRQYGPYLNIIAGVGGMPTLYAEGLFDPMQSLIIARGQYINGTVVQVQLRLLPNWMLQGIMTAQGMIGMPMQAPILMGKVA